MADIIPFNKHKFLKEQEQIIKDEEKKLLMRQQGLAPTDKFEDDEVVVSKRGAFRKTSSIELANDPTKPQIFKISLNRVTQKVSVTNKEGTWNGELPSDPDIFAFFGNDTTKFVIAQADASGKLHIEWGITLADQHKF